MGGLGGGSLGKWQFVESWQDCQLVKLCLLEGEETGKRSRGRVPVENGKMKGFPWNGMNTFFFFFDTWQQCVRLDGRKDILLNRRCSYCVQGEIYEEP